MGGKAVLFKYLTVGVLIAHCIIGSKCDAFRDDKGSSQCDDPIIIGILQPVSVFRPVLEGLSFAAYLAVEHINEAGGITQREGDQMTNRCLDLRIKDTMGSEVVGVEKIMEFNDEGINILIGPAYSSVMLGGVADYAIENNILLISASATSAGVSDLDDKGLIWRTIPSDKLQGQVAAEYMYTNMGVREVAVIHTSESYASGLASVFSEVFASKPDTTIVRTVEIPFEDCESYDYTEHLRQLFENEPGVIFLLTRSANCTAKITNDIAYGQLDAYGPTYFAAEGAADDLLVNGNTSVLERFRGIAPASDESDPNYVQGKQMYADRFGFEPNQFALATYDALTLIALGMEKTGTTNPTAVASVLRDISGQGGTTINVNQFAKAKEILSGGGEIDYDGVTGEIAFDEYGDPSNAVYNIWKIENNEYVVEDTVYWQN